MKTENSFNGLLKSEKKEFTSISKSLKVDLKKEVTSLSYWCKFLANTAKGNKELRALLEIRLGEKLPTKGDELTKLLVKTTLLGYKLKTSDGIICIAKLCKVGNYSETYFVKKEMYTFLSVYSALIRHTDVKNTIVEISDLETAEALLTAKVELWEIEQGDTENETI